MGTMLSKTLSSKLANFVFSTSFEDIPENIRIIAKYHLLDTVGCCIAATPYESSKKLVEYVLFEGGNCQASAIGVDKLVSISQAAFINGILARSLEFDDMCMPDLHPSGVIIPTLLSVAEFTKKTGKDIINAISIGLEICIRLSRAGIDSDFKSHFLEKGLDSSAICGLIASAAIAAKLLNKDLVKIEQAINISVSFASGLLEGNRTGGEIKKFQSGWAAQSAVNAAFLSEKGIRGPEQSLEGRYGLYSAFLDGKFNPSAIIENLGSEWLCSDMRFKPYPSNYYTHPGIDGALKLRNYGIKSEDIKLIDLIVADPMLRAIGEPLERKQNPRNAYESKFSAPYTIASALIGGAGLGLGNEDFTDELCLEPQRKLLMKKIKVSSNEQCNKIFPQHAPAILTVELKDGKVLKKEIFMNRGSKELPLTSEELVIKFESNICDILKDKEIYFLKEKLLNIDKEDTLSKIYKILRF